MIKNIVYDFQIRQKKFDEDNKKTIRKEKYKNPLQVNDKLPSDYDHNWTIQEKIKFLQKKLPIDQRLGKSF